MNVDILHLEAVITLQIRLAMLRYQGHQSFT